MPKNIFINGASGRIGRAVTYNLTNLENSNLQIVGVNDPVGIDKILQSLSAKDTVHGKYNWDVSKVDENTISINGDKIRVFAERDLAKIPFREMDVWLVEECSGFYGDDKKDANKKPSKAFLDQGVEKVILSYAANHADIMLVTGVNHELYNPLEHRLIANASCTTKALASPLKVLLDNGVAVDSLLMDTVHAATNSGELVKLLNNIALQKTGAAKATGKVIPALEGKMDGFAARVPTNDASFANLYFVARYNGELTSEKVNDILLQHAGDEKYCGRVGFCKQKEATTLTDVLGRIENGIVVLPQTRVHELPYGVLQYRGDNVKPYHISLVCGYDNEAAPPRDQALLTEYIAFREK